MLPMIMNNYRNAMNWMPGFLNDFFYDTPTSREVHPTCPAINVSEDKKGYKLDLAVPGTTKQDYNIQITEDGNLMVSLEKKNKQEEKSEDGKRYLRREFSYQKFSQAFTLPDDVERSGITATVTDGVLTISLPKKEQEALPAGRMIEIK